MDKLWWDELKTRIGLGIRARERREPITLEAPKPVLALPAPVNDRQREMVRLRKEEGLTYREIGERFGVSTATAYQAIQRSGEFQPTRKLRAVTEDQPRRTRPILWERDDELMLLSRQEAERVRAFLPGQRVRRTLERGIFGNGNLGLPPNATGVVKLASAEDTHTMVVLVDGRYTPDSYFRGYWETPEWPMSERYWQIRQERIAA